MKICFIISKYVSFFNVLDNEIFSNFQYRINYTEWIALPTNEKFPNQLVILFLLSELKRASLSLITASITKLANTKIIILVHRQIGFNFTSDNDHRPIKFDSLISKVSA